MEKVAPKFYLSLLSFIHVFSNPHTANADAKFKVDVDSILADQPRCMSDGTPMIDIGDMIYYISKLKLHKAAGIDDIVNEHVIFGGNHLVVHLCLLFNYSRDIEIMS